jgi:protein-disulfide isomerase
VKLFRRLFVALLLICLGCSAQSAAPAAPSTAPAAGDVNQKIEHRVRAYYSIPADVQITVGPTRASDFPNYDALTVKLEGQGKKTEYEFLLSKDQKTLLRITKMDLTSDPYAENMKKIDVEGRPFRGNKDAKVVVVNYDDFECPFCSKMHQIFFPEVLKEYSDRVKFVYKDYPLSEIHPWATHAAVDANCLAAQNNDAYWDFADYIHNNQREVSAEKTKDAQFAALDRLTTDQGKKHGLDDTKLQTCIKAQNEDSIKASMREAESVGVNATPTWFVNGQEIDGALPLDKVRDTLDRALQQQGVAAPIHAAAATGPADSHASN